MFSDKTMNIGKIVNILILITCAGNIYAQTEIPILQIDTVKKIETENFLHRTNIDNLVRNPYPAKLPVVDLHDKYNQPLQQQHAKIQPPQIYCFYTVHLLPTNRRFLVNCLLNKAVIFQVKLQKNWHIH